MNQCSINCKKIGTLGLLLVVIFHVLSGISQIEGYNEKRVIIGDGVNLPQSALTHSPIIIDGNEALSEFCAGKGTDGSIFNPHVIENYFINGPYTVGIQIKNTDLHLIIRNCVINDERRQRCTGIEIVNCNNINISSNEMIGKWQGVLLNLSQNIIISNNNCSKTQAGIRLRDSESNIISMNNFSNITYGISLRDSRANSIFVNNCSNNLGGIYLGNSEHNNISSNEFLNNRDIGVSLYLGSDHNTISFNKISATKGKAINIENSNNCSLIGNNISNNEDIGIYIENSKNTEIYENICYNNSKHGLFLASSDLNVISRNKFMNNKETGLFMGFSNYNMIWNNAFIDNYGAQAVIWENKSIGNTWYSDKIGNYWSDYLNQNPEAKSESNGITWDTPYCIGNDQDSYPLVEPPLIFKENQPSVVFGFPALILLGFCGLTLWILIQRLKIMKEKKNREMCPIFDY